LSCSSRGSFDSLKKGRLAPCAVGKGGQNRKSRGEEKNLVFLIGKRFRGTPARNENMCALSNKQNRRKKRISGERHVTDSVEGKRGHFFLPSGVDVVSKTVRGILLFPRGARGVPVEEMGDLVKKRKRHPLSGRKKVKPPEGKGILSLLGQKHERIWSRRGEIVDHGGKKEKGQPTTSRKGIETKLITLQHKN